jgi:alcohol dehydrogenase (cytochrome c)
MKLLAVFLVAMSAFAQDWPTYNGDYSGQRFSPLTRINQANIDSLSLAWVYRPAPGRGSSTPTIKGTPIEVNGVLYVTVPDHVWAVDAHTGREIWHYVWASPDCNLVALDTAHGTERWHTPICELEQFYYASSAPVIVREHVITGVSGDDLDIPGYIESHNANTGKLEWRWYAHPEPGSPEAKTWPSVEAMMHGGGMTWVPGTYDPALNLYYFGTGNPQPVIAGQGREGSNLYTESIVALNPDTGKLAWYFQPSPHDTHDWDAVQTPVLFDGQIEGRPRKLLAQASRNGWFFVLDRATGERLVSAEFVKTNWSLGVDAKGQPIPNPAKRPQSDGALVTPNQGGAINWPPPSFDPETGLFYANAARAWSVYYLYDDSDKPEGWGGNDRGGYSEALLQAIDYKTGKVAWSHKWPGGGGGVRSGLLSTAGKLLFAGDPSGNFVALDPATGAVLWHAGLQANVSNGPITYELDGLQYLVVAAGDTLYGFAK